MHSHTPSLQLALGPHGEGLQGSSATGAGVAIKNLNKNNIKYF
jgi:hypothetical protein